MASVRTNHTPTLLDNGQILLTGGQNNNDGDGLSTAEVYDPVANTFTLLPVPMTTPRGGHTATLLPNGKVLLTGGFNNSAVSLDTAELYDPTTHTFTLLAATMTSHRAQHTATLLPNGELLLTGGSSAHTNSNTAEVYDPVANTFTALTATMTTARSGHTATLLPSGLVLLTGGGDLDTNPFSFLNTAEVYDPVANSFTAITATMTSPRFVHTATLLPSGLVLLTGGVSGGSRNSAAHTGTVTVLNTAELYAP
jgi:N-acetylneuraminic acid mutarotase